MANEKHFFRVFFFFLNFSSINPLGDCKMKHPHPENNKIAESVSPVHVIDHANTLRFVFIQRQMAF